MAWWIPAAATAASSLLGHAAQKRAGGRPAMQTVDTSPITDRMQDVRDRGQFEFDSMLGAANAGTGFQSMANERMGQATGMPGAFSARNDQMGTQGRSQAFGQAMAGRQHRDQMLNQLTGSLMDINAMNTGIKNQNAQNKWEDQAGKYTNLIRGLGGAAAQFGSDWTAQGIHKDTMDRWDQHSEKMGGILDHVLGGGRIAAKPGESTMNYSRSLFDTKPNIGAANRGIGGTSGFPFFKPGG